METEAQEEKVAELEVSGPEFEPYLQLVTAI
jgi:hypothetical protein